MTTKKRTCIKVGAMSYAKLIRSLMDGTRTLQELAEETGLHYLTVAQYCAALHREGAIHICMWEKDSLNRDAIKVYQLGIGKDARRQRMTSAERQQRTRDKRKHRDMIHATSRRSYEHTGSAASAPAF